jgi:putative ABC transport system substrate-binding protein
MKRREFIAGLGSAAALPMAVRAQQPVLPVIGFLHSESAESRHEQVAAFRRGLAESGYTEGRNVTVEYLWGDGQHDRLPALAAELIRRRVSVIVAIPTPAVAAAKAATRTIPIVFYTGADPVEAGFVASLNRPGGNLTGVTALNVELSGKRIDLLRQLVPAATVIAWLTNPTNPIVSEAETRESQKAARILGIHLLIVNASVPSEIETAFATLAQQGASTLIVSADAVFTTQDKQIIALATRYAVPTMYPYRESPQLGGLASYGVNNVDHYRQTGVYAGTILKGVKPADLPVQQPTKFEFVLNLKTAKALGLTISPGILAIADEVIE